MPEIGDEYTLYACETCAARCISERPVCSVCVMPDAKWRPVKVMVVVVGDVV